MRRKSTRIFPELLPESTLGRREGEGLSVRPSRLTLPAFLSYLSQLKGKSIKLDKQSYSCYTLSQQELFKGE
uniref:Uncharacterized protein n=1 Tax=Thermogemmatispora argillosa TaxID=2045280 RepID=A0A455T0Y2_9CHLR|nr:hypothetical protein KTA_12200 [Thermogemmatispora argillosa]